MVIYVDVEYEFHKLVFEVLFTVLILKGCIMVEAGNKTQAVQGSWPSGVVGY